MDSVLLPFLVGILVVAVLLVIVILFTKKGGVQLDVNKYRSKWLAIERQLQKDNAASYQLSILNADKLLDHALKERGTKGETMGERMKTLQTTWSNANAVWGAHKLRNQVAHEPDVQLSYDLTRRALASFKQALKDVGAI
jgi:hypothetical protein